MAIKVLFEFKLNENAIDQGKKKLSEILVDTRAFDGCVSVEVVADLKDATHYVLLETWLSKEHYFAYGKWRAGDGATDLGTFFSAPPAISLFEITDI